MKKENTQMATKKFDTMFSLLNFTFGSVLAGSGVK